MQVLGQMVGCSGGTLGANASPTSPPQTAGEGLGERWGRLCGRSRSSPHSPGGVRPDLVVVLSLLQIMTRDGKVVEMGRVGSRSGASG